MNGSTFTNFRSVRRKQKFTPKSGGILVNCKAKWSRDKGKIPSCPRYLHCLYVETCRETQNVLMKISHHARGLSSCQLQSVSLSTWESLPLLSPCIQHNTSKHHRHHSYAFMPHSTPGPYVQWVCTHTPKVLEVPPHQWLSTALQQILFVVNGTAWRSCNVTLQKTVRKFHK